MSPFINVVRDSIYKGKRVEKSDWENECRPPHVEITNGGEARWAMEGANGDR